MHDSLQYHFFFRSFFVAVRVFHTPSLLHHSAWLYDLASGETVELLNSYEPLSRVGDAGDLRLRGEALDSTLIIHQSACIDHAGVGGRCYVCVSVCFAGARALRSRARRPRGAAAETDGCGGDGEAA